MTTLHNNQYFSANIWLEAMKEKENKRLAVLEEQTDGAVLDNQTDVLNSQVEVIFEKEDLQENSDETRHLREIHTELQFMPFRSLAL